MKRKKKNVTKVEIVSVQGNSTKGKPLNGFNVCHDDSSRLNNNGN